MTANVKVEVAFADGAMAASPTWTDVSAYVDLSRGITLNRGRGRTATQAEPGRCSLTLNNDDGRFTWGDPAGAYGLGMGDQPQLRQPLRVSADVGSGYVPIWTGYVDEWAGGWDGGVRPVVRVTASDRLAKLALLNLDDGAIMSEIKDAGPVAYYPLDEPSGATSVGDRTPDSLAPLADTPLGSGGGTVDLGSGVSPDGIGTVAAFTPASSTSARHLTGPRQLVASDSWTLSAWFIVSSYPTTYGVLASASSVPEYCVARISVVDNGGFGHGVGVGWSASFSAEGGIYYTTAIDDGGWHHLAGVYDDAAGGWLLYLDGALVDSNTYAAGTFEFDTISIGGGRLNPTDTGQNPFDGNIAHVALFDRALSLADITRLYESGWSSGPFYGDTASERFERLCRLGALPAGSYATDATATTVLGAQPLDGVGLMDAILQVTDSERGVAYVDGAGVLTYLSSASVSGLTSALTLGPSDVDQDVTLTTNDQELVNDVTVTRPGGATQRRADQASIDSIGQAATTVDTLLTTDAAAGALADLLLSQGLVVHPRTDDLTLDLRAKATTIDADAAVALDTGSRVTVAGLPDGAPASTLELMVTGVAHRITHVEWDLTLTVAPLQTLPAWVLEDATLGVLGVTTRLAYSSATDELLAEATLWLDAATVTRGAQTVENLGSSGSALDATVGATATAGEASEPVILPWDGDNYVYLPGVSSNYMSVPDAAALDITGDIDVRAQVALDDWTPSNETHLVGKWGAPGQLSWIFSVAATTGSLILYWSVDGSTFLSRTSTVPVPFLNGERAWVRATLDVNDGGSHTVTFYTSTDKVPEWAVLGAPVTTAGTTSLFSSSSDVEVGTIYGGSYAYQQACYRALVYNGIDGTLVLDIDPSVITTGSATSFTATTGQTVTISRWTSGRKAAVVLSSCLLFATDDYLEVPDHPDLDFDADDSFTVLAVHRAWATFGTNDVLVAKKADTTATTQGWALTAGSSTAAQGQAQIGDGGGTTMYAEASRATTWGVYNTGWRVKAYAYPSAFTINTIDIYLDSAVPGGTTCYVGIGVDGSQNYYYDGTPWTAKAVVPTGVTGWVRCTLDSSVLMNWAVDSVPQYVIFDEVLGDYITAYQGTSTLSGIVNDDAYYWGSGWTAISTTHPKFRLYNVADGGATAVSGSRTSGAVSVVATVRNVTADTLTTYLNGVAGTPVTDPTTGTLANSEVVRVGRLSGAGTEYADMELLAVAVWRRALTAAEIDLVTTRYQARWP